MPEFQPICGELLFVPIGKILNPESIETLDDREALRRVMLAEVRIERCQGFQECTFDMSMAPGEHEGTPGYYISLGCDGGVLGCPRRVMDGCTVILRSLTKISVHPLQLDSGPSTSDA